MTGPDGDALRARIAALTPEERSRFFDRIGQGPSASAERPADGRQDDSRAPLTPGQEQMWLLAQDPTRSHSYHRLLALEITGKMVRSALENALVMLVERHEILRSRFRVGSEGLEQVVYPAALPDLEISDLRAANDRLGAVAADLVDTPFALADETPLHCRVARLTDDRFAVLFCIHHIAADAWSDGVIVADFSAFYSSCLRGVEDAKPPALPVQYRDFARRRRAERGSHDHRSSSDFWRAELAGPLPAAPKAHTVTDPRGRRDRGSLIIEEVPVRLTSAIRSMAQQIGATPFAVWLAAYASALRSHYGEDILITSPTAGRDRVELERLVGYFVEPVILRLRLGPVGSTFRDLVARIQQISMRCLEHKDVRPEVLQGILRDAGVTSWESLAVAGFAYQSVPLPSIDLPEFSTRVLRLDPGTAKSAVTLYIWDQGGGVTLGLEYSHGAFTDAEGRALLDDLTSIMQEAIELPDVPLEVPVVRRDDLDGVYEASNLTRTQVLIWLDQRLRPSEPIYNIPVLYTFFTEIDPARFDAAFHRVVRSIDALRMRIVERAGVPFQEVTDDPPAAHRLIDVSSVPEPRAEAVRLAQERAGRALRLDATLFDSVLIKVGDTEYSWLICCHHIICDGWSVWLLLLRLQEAYGSELELPSPSFLDAVNGQRRRESGEQSRVAKEYWERKILNGPAPSGAVGARSARPATRVVRDLGVERSNRLRSLVSDAAVPTGPGGLGVLAALCATALLWQWRMTGRTRIRIGTPFHNRRNRELRETVGVLMSVYPIDAEIRPGDSGRTLLAGIADELAGAIRHRGYVAAGGLGAGDVDVLVNFQTIAESEFLGRPFGVDWLHPGVADEPLAMQLDDFTGTGNLRLSIDVRRDAFGGHDATLIGEQLLAALDALVTGVSSPLHEMSFLSPLDEAGVDQVNTAERVAESFRPVFEHIEDWAIAAPDRPALRWNGESVSYAELLRRVRAVAFALRKRGVDAESTVCAYLPRGPEMVIAVLGVWYSGGAYIPIDAEYSRHRLRPAVLDARPEVILSSPAVLADSEVAGTSVVDIADAMADDAPAGFTGREPATGDLAYVIYTSGTTGAAKGCMITHGNLHHSYLGWGRRLDLRGKPARHLQMASPSFDVFTQDLINSLCFGGTLVLCPRRTLVDPAELLDLIEAERITHAEFVPSVLRPLAAFAARSGRSLSGWELLIVGSEAWSWWDHQRVADLCGPSTRLANSYGLSESSVTNTFQYLDGSAGEPGQNVPIGTPFAGQYVYVLDPAGRRLPYGATGELHLGGPSIGRGYWAQAASTAEKFLPDPFSPAPGARMLRTGDLARFDRDGNLEYLGRIDEQVKIDGVRVEPSEVEAVLRQCPGVNGAAVAFAGSGVAAGGLVAYIIARGERTPTATSVRRFLASRLAPALVPRRFVELKSLPLNSSGKINRAELPDPSHCRLLPDATLVAPRTEVERAVAEVWLALLGRDQIDVDENFFESGGSSLALVRAQQLLQAQFRRAVPISALFQYPTVAALAEYLANDRSAVIGEPRIDAAENRLARRRRLRETAPKSPSSEPMRRDVRPS